MNSSSLFYDKTWVDWQTNLFLIYCDFDLKQNSCLMDPDFKNTSTTFCTIFRQIRYIYRPDRFITFTHHCQENGSFKFSIFRRKW